MKIRYISSQDWEYGTYRKIFTIINMKIIFLDIDWVLIPFGGSPERCKIRDLFERTKIDWEDVILPKLNPVCVKNLWEIIEKTGARLVISSSWRHRWSHLQKMLQNAENESWDNLWNHVTSKTPSMTWAWRWNEILQYLNEYHSTCKEWWHITHWIALDDDDAGMSRIRDLNCLVQTRSHIWLDEDSARLAISLLNI